MNWLHKFFIKPPEQVRRRETQSCAPDARAFNSGTSNRLNNDWTTTNRSGNSEVFNSLLTTRARARDLEQNNDYAERIYKLLENNVLGHAGITLQMKVKEYDGKLDRVANDKIESAWYKWGQKQFASIDGSDSWLTMQKLMLRSTARDGGAFARVVTGAANDFNYSLQLKEADFLDVQFNGKASNGNRIVMGVELGEFTSGKVTFEKPVAYWFFKTHPGDTYNFGTISSNLSLERIPAEEIIHTFKKRRIGDVVGFPWMGVSMENLKQLDGYQQAALVMARESACKGGFITKTAPVEFQGEVDDNGDKQYSVEPGQVQELPMGMNFQQYDPKHPMTEYPNFVKSALRRFSSGMGVSYNGLANDLEGVNFSSMRSGKLDEQEEFKGIQEWFIEVFVGEVFKQWLPAAILSGQLNLPMAKLFKFDAAEWKPRRWSWVDPLKDQEANAFAINNGMNSPRKIIAESGGDIEDVYQEIAEDKKLAEQYGLKFSYDTPVLSNAPPDSGG